MGALCVVGYAERMSPVNKQRATAVWLLTLMLAGCTTDGADSVRFLSSTELDCAATIDALDAAPEDYQAILDSVALPETDSQHEMGRTDPESGMRFAKMGLLVKSGKASTITVNPDSGDATIRIGWGTIAVGEPPSPPPVEQIVVPRCESDSAWIVYAGGVWVSEPVCVGLTVSSGDRSESISIPIDTDCP